MISSISYNRYEVLLPSPLSMYIANYNLFPASAAWALALDMYIYRRHGLKGERIYRIAGNIGGELNLADCEQTAKLKSANVYSRVIT